MKLTGLLADDEAVSPVIGVILMVAITVILAAVIGTFVLGLGDQVDSSAPQASFTFDFTNKSADNTAGNEDTLKITHDGGDTIEASQLTFEVTDAEAADGDYSTGANIQSNNDWATIGSSGDVTAGSSVTLDNNVFTAGGSGLPTDTEGDGTADEDLQLEGATVRIVWSDTGADSSATLGKWEGPAA